jgi:hypothetical protein
MASTPVRPEKIDLRVSPEAKRTLQAAAAAQDRSLSEFVVKARWGGLRKRCPTGSGSASMRAVGRRSSPPWRDPPRPGRDSENCSVPAARSITGRDGSAAANRATRSHARGRGFRLRAGATQQVSHPARAAEPAGRRFPHLCRGRGRPGGRLFHARVRRGGAGRGSAADRQGARAASGPDHGVGATRRRRGQAGMRAGGRPAQGCDSPNAPGGRHRGAAGVCRPRQGRCLAGVLRQ